MMLGDEEWLALKSALDEVRPRAGRPAARGGAAHDRGRALAVAERGALAGGAGRVRSVVASGAAPHPLVEGGRVGPAVRAPARGGAARRGRGLRGRDGRGRAPEGGRRAQRGGTSRERDRREALGRSRGGFSTKACAACDASGRPLALALLPGRAAELTAAPALLAAVVALGVVLRVVCDRAYSSAAWRALIAALGAEPVVPARPSHKSAPSHDPVAYRRRHEVENLWARLKEWRAVATRYEKTAASYLGDRHLAAAFEWMPVP